MIAVNFRGTLGKLETLLRKVKQVTWGNSRAVYSNVRGFLSLHIMTKANEITTNFEDGPQNLKQPIRNKELHLSRGI